MSGTETPPPVKKSFLETFFATSTQLNELEARRRRFSDPLNIVDPVADPNFIKQKAVELSDDLSLEILKDAGVRAYAEKHPVQFAAALIAGTGTLLGRLVEVALRPVFYALETSTKTLRPGIPDLLDLQTQNIDLDTVAPDYYQKKDEGVGQPE